MALYELVSLRKHLLETLDTEPVEKELAKLIDNIQSLTIKVNGIDEQNLKFINDLNQYYNQILDQIKATDPKLQAHLATLNDQIDVITHQLFANNYDLEENTGGVEHIRNNRRINVRPDIEDYIKHRIMLHTSWRYPALEIGCRDGEWTQYMISSDPLYLIDLHKEFLTAATANFTPEFQRRVRLYNLVNHDLTVLPANQFGLVFSWGYFNYVGLDTMKHYLKQIYSLLRPGGTFFFSYNDGDTPAGAGMAECFAQTYMPKGMLLALSESIGFELETDSFFEPNISSLELRKPGVLETNKLHQVMGEIKFINV